MSTWVIDVARLSDACAHIFETLTSENAAVLSYISYYQTTWVISFQFYMAETDKYFNTGRLATGPVSLFLLEVVGAKVFPTRATGSR